MSHLRQRPFFAGDSFSVASPGGERRIYIIWLFAVAFWNGSSDYYHHSYYYHYHHHYWTTRQEEDKIGKKTEELPLATAANSVSQALRFFKASSTVNNNPAFPYISPYAQGQKPTQGQAATSKEFSFIIALVISFSAAEASRISFAGIIVFQSSRGSIRRHVFLKDHQRSKRFFFLWFFNVLFSPGQQGPRWFQ